MLTLRNIHAVNNATKSAMYETYIHYENILVLLKLNHVVSQCLFSCCFCNIQLQKGIVENLYGFLLQGSTLRSSFREQNC